MGASLVLLFLVVKDADQDGRDHGLGDSQLEFTTFVGADRHVEDVLCVRFWGDVLDFEPVQFEMGSVYLRQVVQSPS